jgi:phosphatidylethanolamine/phosphatidyl-N-methylethanolamine N-methyltransferase
LKVGAVSPSGRALARAVAAEIDPSIPGAVVELGPGTGPVTEALVERGIAPERLVLVEYDPEFCALLRRRYPGATVIEGDAYALADTLSGIIKEPLAAIASCLPLMTRPLSVRVRLLNAAIRMLQPGAPFVQFTYAMTAPIPSRKRRYRITSSPRIWKNLPPARVWVYRAD